MIIIPPTPWITDVCDACEGLIRAYLQSDLTKGASRRFESEVEYYTMLKLMIRHFESLIMLGRHDLVTAPSANVIARTIFETGVRARWMFVPIDPFEREVRWLLLLRSATVQAGRLARNAHVPKTVSDKYQREENSLSHFDQNISNLLKDQGYLIPKQAPTFSEMLKELKEPDLYTHYILLSAYSHSNFEAASLFRRNLGTAKQLGEFTSESDWWLPLYVSWRAFYHASKVLIKQWDADMTQFESRAKLSAFEELFRQRGFLGPG